MDMLPKGKKLRRLVSEFQFYHTFLSQPVEPEQKQFFQQQSKGTRVVHRQLQWGRLCKFDSCSTSWWQAVRCSELSVHQRADCITATGAMARPPRSRKTCKVISSNWISLTVVFQKKSLIDPPCRHIRNGTSCASPHGQINCPTDKCVLDGSVRLTRRYGYVMFVLVCSLLSCFLPYQYLSWYNVITSPSSLVSVFFLWYGRSRSKARSLHEKKL